MVQVEADVVVPVELASARQESAARTLRPKLHRLWDTCLGELDETAVERSAEHLELKSEVDLSNVDMALDRLRLDDSVTPVRRFRGGTSAARQRLASFLEDRFEGYTGGRREPGAFQCSLLSPYLHFGQISPVEVALRVRRAADPARTRIAAPISRS